MEDFDKRFFALDIFRFFFSRQACSPLIQLFFGFASDIDQTNINRDIRDGNWLSRVRQNRGPGRSLESSITSLELGRATLSTW